MHSSAVQTDACHASSSFSWHCSAALGHRTRAGLRFVSFRGTLRLDAYRISTDASLYPINLDIWNLNPPFSALAALAQSTRLDVFRLLVKHEPDGLAAGEIAKALAVPQNTMSAHLAVLSRAGLVTARRISRSIVYRADLARFQAVMSFLAATIAAAAARKSARR